MSDSEKINQKKKKRFLPIAIAIFGFIIFLPIVWWYSVGPGFYYTFRFFGIDYAGGQDGTHLMNYMTDEQLRQMMSPEHYEAWKKVHGNKDNAKESKE
ncbi:MAG: hypothetical protein KJ017_04310 [Alphaproteobacteria bacterium]|nr:hypothetical protein [Alphaproteobacteria bacterium]